MIARVNLWLLSATIALLPLLVPRGPAQSAPVDAVEPVNPGLEQLVVARVLEVSAHPNPKFTKVRMTVVDDGTGEPKTVACGAANVTAGRLYPFARVGTRVPGGKATRCNCSIYLKLMWTGAIVKPDAFRLLTSESEATGYVWGGRVSTRFFCKHCGTAVFGRGELAQLGGAFVSINVCTLDDVDVNTLRIEHWDGRHDNWMAGTRPTPWPVFPEAS